LLDPPVWVPELPLWDPPEDPVPLTVGVVAEPVLVVGLGRVGVGAGGFVRAGVVVPPATGWVT
jgi:hypothetical protein